MTRTRMLAVSLVALAVIGLVVIVSSSSLTFLSGAQRSQRRERFGFGTPATAAEIRVADDDVTPTGHGLPRDSGTVAEGEVVYKTRCAACHGLNGVEGPMDKLVGRVPGDSFPFGRDPRTLGDRTIGNYWPYATTVYDFIHRAMPQDQPGSLSPHQVYGVVAYLLYRNG